MVYAVQMPSPGMTLLPSFINIATCVKSIFRIFLSNLNGCNVDITDGRDL
jgi:hypothetical protein